MSCVCLEEFFPWCTGHHTGSLTLDVPGCTHNAVALCRQKVMLGYACRSAPSRCLRCFTVQHNIVPCLHFCSITCTNKQTNKQTASEQNLHFPRWLLTWKQPKLLNKLAEYNSQQQKEQIYYIRILPSFHSGTGLWLKYFHVLKIKQQKCLLVSMYCFHE